MDVSVKFPLTNRELFDLGGGKPLRFAATFAEFWEVVETAEYRVDFFDHQIIASMSYESEDHSALTTRLSHLLQNIFWDNPASKVHNSNRPICIPDCDHAVPVSTSPLISVNSRATELLAVPLATMSKACSSGTPARIITDSCRVNIVMSFSVIFLPVKLLGPFWRLAAE